MRKTCLRVLLPTLCLLAACTRTPARVADAGAPKPPVAWPADLMKGVVRIELSAPRPGGAAETASLERRADGIWWMTSPHPGEADPDSIDRLTFALAPPQLAPPAGPAGEVRFDIRLLRADGTQSRVTTYQAPLGQPVRVVIAGAGEFWVSPVEFPTKLPAPFEFASAGLWVSARHDASSLEVRSGALTYALTGRGKNWQLVGGRKSIIDLDNFVGAFVGRQAIGHAFAKDAAALGLDPPRATATLCAGAVCKAFRLGSVTQGGVTRYYGQAPDSDPVELRDTEWNLVVNGPYQGPRAPH